MKLKKLLVATLAGIMVLGAVSSVFASEIVRSTAWWGDDMETGQNYELDGDGTWTVVVAAAAYSGTLDGEDFTVPPNFNVEIVDADLSGEYYITSNTLGSIWIAGDSMEDENMTGDTSGTQSFTTATGDLWEIYVTREGQDFLFEYYLNGTKVIKQSVTGTNMPENACLHIIGATGYCEVECTTDGTVPSLDALTVDWYGFDVDYGEVPESTASDDTDVAEEEDTTAVDDADVADDNADADVDADADADASTTDTSTTSESGSVNVAAIVIVIIVIVVIIIIIIAVVMSKKKKK